MPWLMVVELREVVLCKRRRASGASAAILLQAPACGGASAFRPAARLVTTD